MQDPKFVHLRIHSDFSMVDGMKKVPALVKAVAAQNMPAMALTDQGNMCGLVRFYGAAQGAGIKPVLGADLWMQSPEFGDELTRLTTLCLNDQGYKNVTLLISRAYERGHIQGRPVIDREWLVELNEGVIVLSGAREGDLGCALLRNNTQLADNLTEFYQQTFPDRYYLELVRTGRPQEEEYLHQAVNWAKSQQLPVVATNDVVFLQPSDFDAHEVRVAIHDGFTIADKRRPRKYSEQQYLRTEDEMCELFSDIPSALANSVEIAKRCNVSVRLGEYFLPDFPTGGLTTDEYMIKVSKEGLEERLEFLFPDPEERAKHRPEYDERLDIELKVINDMGFPGYFLIVMEFIQWSKDNNIPVGPGRGSGAGSLVAYAQKITDLDPLEFDLLFERFLNPERVSMPDFDIDFCMDRRDEVIDHVAELYGRDAVSQIITFGTMAAKAAIRDVGRVLGQAYGFVDRISKLVPPDPGMTLAKAFEAEPKLPELYDADEEVREIIDMARTLEGVTRNAGKHAGGVVISPTKITDFSPLYCDDEGNNPVTQFDKNDVEYAGLVKFDFLGLRTLTIIQWALDMLNPRLEAEGKEAIRIESIPLVDKTSFDMLKRSETTAVFQLESSGMKDLIKRLQPDCFEDIIALVALFRPGPLGSGMVENFINRKHGREEVSYPDAQYQHESLQPILEPTYGVILYQEQVMQIAQVLAGYSLGGADLLRRAMGKKKPEEMAKQRTSFEDGAKDNGIDGELAMKIFDLVEKFAGYGFNKSHSAAYALVSYQTLWLKAHYPAYFMAAVMSADMDNTDKIVTLVDECQRMGLPLNPPDLNSGYYKFSVNDNEEIVYGIGAVKGVGEGPVEVILEEREQNGPFKDLFDFCARIDLKKVNRRILEKLIQSGAMDKLGPHRAALMATLQEAMKAAEQHHKAEAIGQGDMFGLLTTEPEKVEQAFAQTPKWPEAVWLEYERETLGLYLTGHPINQYLGELKHYTSNRLKDLTPTGRGKKVKAAGLVISARQMVSKKSGKRFCILTIDDRSGRLNVGLFGEDCDKYEEIAVKDKILIVEGEVEPDNFDGGLKMSADNMMEIEQARERNCQSVKVILKQQGFSSNLMKELKNTLGEWQHGTTPVRICYYAATAMAELELGTVWRVTPSDKLLQQLESLLGPENVELAFP